MGSPRVWRKAAGVVEGRGMSSGVAVDRGVSSGVAVDRGVSSGVAVDRLSRRQSRREVAVVSVPALLHSCGGARSCTDKTLFGRSERTASFGGVPRRRERCQTTAVYLGVVSCRLSNARALLTPPPPMGTPSCHYPRPLRRMNVAAKELTPPRPRDGSAVATVGLPPHPRTSRRSTATPEDKPSVYRRTRGQAVGLPLHPRTSRRSTATPEDKPSVYRHTRGPRAHSCGVSSRIRTRYSLASCPLLVVSWPSRLPALRP